MFSVALSLSPGRSQNPPGVTRHRFSVEPGLSSPSFEGRGRPAAWHVYYVLLRPWQQQGEQFRSAFAINDAIEAVGAETALEGDYRRALL